MGDPEAGDGGRNWVGSEKKGRSFGKVEEAIVPYLVARVTGKKGLEGVWEKAWTHPQE